MTFEDYDEAVRLFNEFKSRKEKQWIQSKKKSKKNWIKKKKRN